MVKHGPCYATRSEESFVARACAIARLRRARLCPFKIDLIMGVLGKHAQKFFWTWVCHVARASRASP
ncbi:hypothetical protein JCGZ_04202 [Jatropha curcas]|uniref:Uncharacterized protein n=1 Tax=Jatropha curcas TaxID=180498 RepID=A0A067JCT1_JATCU|nr:hypothetical protein JCGZ_04202 [Jatropha curcas]